MDTYIQHFKHLRVDKSPARWPATTCHGAPHKPLLLLAVMDLLAEGSILENVIELTPDLGEVFTNYWSRVMPPERRGNISLPFFYLNSDGFWHLEPQPGKDAILASTRKISSTTHLLELVRCATLDRELFELLCVEKTRNILRTVLIQTYFSSELQDALIEQSNINVDAYVYSKELLEQARKQQVNEGIIEADRYRSVVRSQGFRRAIITAYEHRCAFCALRIITADGHTTVDAAHIVPWSITQNDSLHNGMALCQTCHWVFDEGLISISSNYILMISPQLTMERNSPGHIANLENQAMIGPQDHLLWPDREYLAYHRANIFRRR